VWSGDPREKGSSLAAGLVAVTASSFAVRHPSSIVGRMSVRMSESCAARSRPHGASNSFFLRLLARGTTVLRGATPVSRDAGSLGQERFADGRRGELGMSLMSGSRREKASAHGGGGGGPGRITSSTQ